MAREDFEAYLLSRPDIASRAMLKRHELDHEKYQYMSIQLAWDAWQAGFNSASTKAAEILIEQLENNNDKQEN
jgi:hypothetical protein